MFVKKLLSIVTISALVLGSVYLGGVSVSAADSENESNGVLLDFSMEGGEEPALVDESNEDSEPFDFDNNDTDLAPLIEAPTTEATRSVEEVTKDLNLTEGVITTHVSFYGHSLEGLTAEEAMDEINEYNSELQKTKVTVYFEEEHSETFSTNDLDITFSDEGIQEQVENAVLSGETVMERYKFAKNYANEPLDLTFEILVDADYIDSYLSRTLKDWDADPSEATISYRSGERVIEGGVTGEKFDFTSCSEKIANDFMDLSVLNSEKYEIEADCEVTKPSLTAEEAENYSLIGTFTSYYDAAVTPVLANRQTNLQIASGNMNGSVFEPGERISALTMYKDVTAQNGYRAAGTIMGGSHVDAIGGGICQVTTTLYNAVLMAELDVVYRHNHSMLVTYVPASQDAMVYYEGWDHKSDQYDFVFTNSTSGNLYIEAYVIPEETSITVNLIGIEEHDEKHSVEYVSEIIGMSAPALNLIVDENLTWPPTGRNPYYQVGLNSPLPGVHSRLWKVTYEDGVEVSRELVNENDHYNPQTATYAIVPGGSLAAGICGNRASAYITLHFHYDGGEGGDE